MTRNSRLLALMVAVMLAAAVPALAQSKSAGDWRTDAPGVRHRITAGDLPPPFATPTPRNRSTVVAKPGSAQPQVPLGFEIKPLASGLERPRLLRVAANGDIFMSET